MAPGRGGEVKGTGTADRVLKGYKNSRRLGNRISRKEVKVLDVEFIDLYLFVAYVKPFFFQERLRFEIKGPELKRQKSSSGGGGGAKSKQQQLLLGVVKTKRKSSESGQASTQDCR